MPLAREAGDLEWEVRLPTRASQHAAALGQQAEGLADAHSALELVNQHGLAAVAAVAGVAYQRLADCHARASDYALARQTFLQGCSSATESCSAATSMQSMAYTLGWRC